MDTLAIKIFAAARGFDNEQEAGDVMYKHGFADEYVALAEKLQPVFQEAYHDGITAGITGVTESLRVLQVDESAPVSEDHKNGAREALAGMRYVLGVVHQATDEILNPEPTPQPEPETIAAASLDDVFKAIFGVSPTR